jgi:hypothetical protein
MNDCEERCVVCGDVSDELICRACQALIGAKPLAGVASRETGADTELAGALARE